MDNRQVVLIVAGAVLGLALIGGLMAGLGAPDEAVGVFLAPAGLTLLNPIFWIIVIIVVLARRNKQQQQQQVVVVNGSAPATGPRIRCPSCHGLSRGDAAFCGECGIQLGKTL